MSMSDDHAPTFSGPPAQQGQKAPPRPDPTGQAQGPVSGQAYSSPPETYGDGRGPDIDQQDGAREHAYPSTTPIPPVHGQSPPEQLGYAQQPQYPPQPGYQPEYAQPGYQPEYARPEYARPEYAQPVPQGAPQRERRSKPGLPDGAGRFVRQHVATPETKRLFRTSEFLLTLIGAVLLILAAAIQDNFDAPQMWTLFTLLFVGYIVSRGIAKAGSGRRD